MIRAVPCAPRLARRLLAGLESAKTNSDGDISLDELMARPGSQAYAVLDGAGRWVAAYTLLPAGAVLWSTAFAGRAGFDLTAVLDGLLMQQAAEFSAVMFRTERRGLVAKAQRLGWKIDRLEGRAHYMKKEVK